MQVNMTRGRESGTQTQGRLGAMAKNITLFLALITTGLSAGFFYAWQVASIPGLRLVDDVTYIQTMNAVNSTIRNAGFGFAFFGSIVFVFVALVLRARQWRSVSFALLGSSLLVYLFGLVFITFSIHVPLNTELLTYTDLTNVDVATLRSSYETRWNAWHLVRTYAVIGSFVLLLSAVFFERKLPKRP